MKRGIVTFLLALAVFIGMKQTAEAATATIEIKTDQEISRVGEEFTVTMTITSKPAEEETLQDAAIGDVEGYIVYDADICEYVSAPSCITGGDGMLKLSDTGTYENNNGERTYRIRFRALSRGDALFSMYTKPLILSVKNQTEMSVSYNDLAITVQAAKDASENANLSALKVSPGKLSPAFATTIREYEVTVPYETETLIISALTEDANALVSVNGSTGLKVGENKAVVTVTAENGTEKRYYLYVTRLEKGEEEKDPDEPVPVVNSGIEKGIHAESENGLLKVTCGSSYVVSAEPQDYIAPTGYEETMLFLDGKEIKAYKKRNEPASDYYVLVLKDEAGKSGYYSYDRVEQTIQRFEESRIEIKQLIENDNSHLEKAIREYKNRQIILIFFLAMFLSMTVLMLIIVIRLLKKKHFSSSEDEFEEDGFR